jgi:hypothetical protein
MVSCQAVIDFSITRNLDSAAEMAAAAAVPTGAGCLPYLRGNLSERVR